MLLLLSISEDSLISAFVSRNLRVLDAYSEYYGASASVIKGYLFPRFYVFYDDFHLLPVPYFRYQYVDTVRLRLEEREMDLGLPNLWRAGWGFSWSVLDPQAITGSMAAREATLYARSTLESARGNAIINFRVLLRILHTLRLMLSTLDSAMLGADSLLTVGDNLRSLGRLPPERYLEMRLEFLKLRRARERVEAEYARIRDTVRSLTGVDAEDVSPEGELPPCSPYDSTHLREAQRWRWRAEMARFLPKLFAFGEVWYGRPVGLNRDSSGFGTLYGIRLTLTFDETGRLRARRERAALKVLRARRNGKKRTEVRELDTTLLSEARALYEEGKRLHDMGRMDAFTLFKLRSYYYTLKLDLLRERVEMLRRRTCPVILPEVPPQYTPSP